MPTLGVDLPLAGPDGADGILALQAVRLALRDDATLKLDVRDASRGGFADPHEDEGAGDWRNPGFAAKNIAALAADRNVIVVLGGFNGAVAKAERQAAEQSTVPIVLVSRLPKSVMRAVPIAFGKTYRKAYGEAPDPLAARYYIAARMILNCDARSREELSICLRKRVEWNR
ncbi:MAG: hypothetical protein JOZ59_05950 [Candidatus Eremiobacteraeota bacterium]|nr:hypothetical protein [Candidatus Eremiobacteraeota bacterium]